MYQTTYPLTHPCIYLPTYPLTHANTHTPHNQHTPNTHPLKVLRELYKYEDAAGAFVRERADAKPTINIRVGAVGV